MSIDFKNHISVYLWNVTGPGCLQSSLWVMNFDSSFPVRSKLTKIRSNKNWTGNFLKKVRKYATKQLVHPVQKSDRIGPN